MTRPQPGDALLSLAARTAAVDARVAEAAEPWLEPGIAILASGGYGRRQLFPHSDVDLLLLFESEQLAAERKNAISTFLQGLWDAGMRVSQQVRTPAECLEVHEGNTELNISLLDQRFLLGDRGLYAALSKKFPAFIERNRDALSRNLVQLTRKRHEKYSGTYYHLEPNVKETPGGLRDFQLVQWMGQLRETDSAHLATPTPGDDLQAAFRFLARLRWYLHEASGRDNNVLTFEAQDAVAADDPAEWMREYYRHARAVFRAATRALEAAESRGASLFTQFVDWRSRLSNSEFSVHRERVHFRAPQQLDTNPGLALRLFEFVARHGVSPSREAAAQLEQRVEALSGFFREPQPLWPGLNTVLALPHTPLAVRWMHETGVLFAIFPELTQIECLVVRDFYHRYTVDEHTLVAMQNLQNAQAAYGDLFREAQPTARLMFALLFHDAGKGHGGEGAHVDGSARLADAAMRRIQMPQADREVVRFLIHDHLVLSEALRTRDLEDPEVVDRLAHQVETVERLKALTLLTYADISAVNPTAMTPWRAQQLWQLYLKVYGELTRELEAERIPADVALPRQWAELLEGLPMRYLRTHSQDDIQAHAALEERSRTRGAAVDVRKLDSVWQLTAIAGDRKGLFAAMAGTLAGFGMNILRAEAFSNRRGLILDTFVFADPTRTLDLNPTEVDRLRTTAERVLSGKKDVAEILRNRPKPVPPSRKGRIKTAVAFNSAASSKASLVEIVAEDRPGLLYDLASAISSQGGNIEVVLTDTQAHKAIDVFYVTFDGEKGSAEQEARLGEALRQACG